MKRLPEALNESGIRALLSQPNKRAMNADPFSNTIESHIISLRRKINSVSPGSKNLIHTLPGRGYPISLLNS
ncbi:MAG TPA: winged helix-turn-helix domain-containing protein [Thermodesulfobacteriota bacterium]|nr:winged helix-turn-helix domain-containing protein [Thermodesulfobacteriota bacterium]